MLHTMYSFCMQVGLKQNQDGNSGTGTDMLTGTDLSPVTGASISDSADNSADNSAEVTDTISDTGTFKDVVKGGTPLRAPSSGTNP